MNYITFKGERDGKKVDFDGSYGFQCIDVIRKYIAEMGRPQPAKLGSNGVKFLALNFKQYRDDTQYRYIANNPKDKYQTPRQGDIIIFGSPIATGHIGIVHNATPGSNVIDVFQQNGGRGGMTGLGVDRCMVKSYTYKNVLGRVQKI